MRGIDDEMRGWFSRQATSAGILLSLLVAGLAGCDERRREVEATQPIGFSHARHVDHFQSGKHREEKIKMHLEKLELEEPPDELVAGECATCHDDFSEHSGCGTCHVRFQDEKLRARKDVRACIACHRGAWTGSAAVIPNTLACRPCHEEKARSDSPEEAKLREFLAARRDVPWVRLHRMAEDVHFSHVAHVRWAEMPCTRCHEDMTGKTAPPTSVTVFPMSACLKCHAHEKANTDCLACHK